MTTARFSTAVRAKARAAVAVGAVEPDPVLPRAWTVTSTRDGERYRVIATEGMEYVSCTCPHGRKAGGGASSCYHVAAVLGILGKLDN